MQIRFPKLMKCINFTLDLIIIQKKKSMKKVFGIIAGAAIVLTSCQEQKVEENQATSLPVMKKIETEVLESNGIQLVSVASPQFEKAKIEMVNPSTSVNEGMVDFEFLVENYELGAQTEDASTKACANAAKGQHIHLILNNEPYTAHYEANFQRELPAGNYTALAFLGRSYHEGIKTKDAHVFAQFTVGEPEVKERVNLDQEHIIYNRPKGLYKGADTAQVMLDFYLLNTTISESGNTVRVTINNAAKFMISQWQPYFIKGLKRGTNSIKLELLGPDGKIIPGPYNVVERTIIVEDDSMDNTMKNEMVQEELKKVEG